MLSMKKRRKKTELNRLFLGQCEHLRKPTIDFRWQKLWNLVRHSSHRGNSLFETDLKKKSQRKWLRWVLAIDENDVSYTLTMNCLFLCFRSVELLFIEEKQKKREDHFQLHVNSLTVTHTVGKRTIQLLYFYL